jgi:hypothetical protein
MSVDEIIGKLKLRSSSYFDTNDTLQPSPKLINDNDHHIVYNDDDQDDAYDEDDQDEDDEYTNSDFSDSNSTNDDDDDVTTTTPTPPSIARKKIFHSNCTVIIQYGKEKGTKCDKDTQNGRAYCKDHLPTLTEQQPYFNHFYTWVQLDPLVEFSVMTEQLKLNLYRLFMSKVRMLSYILNNPSEVNYISFDYASIPKEVYVMQEYTKRDKAKWKKDHTDKYNFMQLPSDILIQWNAYRKYRNLTKQYRTENGILDTMTYLKWKNKRQFLMRAPSSS